MTAQPLDDRPLAGRRIAVTRAKSQAPELSERLVSLGAEVIELPAIDIVPVPPDALDAALHRIATYDWILFTSSNAVDIVVDRMQELDIGWDAVSDARVGSIGRSTADRIRHRGGSVQFVPDKAVAEAMLDGLMSRGVTGSRILLPRARVARDTLPDGLRAAGAWVDVVVVYETRMTEFDDRVVRELLDGRVDCITFASQSSVRNTLDAIGGRLPDRVDVACIGPVTAEAARTAGLRVDILATNYSITGMIDALVKHFEAGREVERA